MLKTVQLKYGFCKNGYFKLKISAGMIENLKARNMALNPIPFRSTEMFKNVGIFVPKETKISTSLNILVLLKGVGVSVIFFCLQTGFADRRVHQRKLKK